MANYAFLAGSPVAGTRPSGWTGGRVFEAKYTVPVFWLALFEPGDLRDDAVAITTQSAALAAWARRRSGLARFVGEEHAMLLAAWEAVIATELGPYIVLEADQIEAMGVDEFASARPGVLAALDALARGPLSTEMRTPLEYLCNLDGGWRTRDFVQSNLAGFADGWPPEPEELAWRAAMARTTATPRDFEPSAPLRVGDVVRHLLHGDGVVTKVDGNRSEITFRSGVVTLGRTAKPMPDPYGPTTPLGQFLAAPSDELRAAACDATRVQLLGRGDVYASDEVLAKHWRRLVGPLARVINESYLAFRGGFLACAALHAPYEIDRGHAFLAKLGPSGEALLRHPLWRTLEVLFGGDDDDVILVATHPNFISLSSISITTAGLSRLARHTESVRIRSATTNARSTQGLAVEPRDAWHDALEVGALRELRELMIDLYPIEEAGGTFAPRDLAWLLEAPLGRQLEGLVVYSNGDLRQTVAAWHDVLQAHPSLARVDFAPGPTAIRVERDRVRVATNGNDVDLVAAAFTGAPRTLPTIVSYIGDVAVADAVSEALRAHVDHVERGREVSPTWPPQF